MKPEIKTITWITCSLFIFLLAVNTWPVLSQEDLDSESLVRQGEALIKEGDYANALALFEKAIPLTGNEDLLARIYLKVSIIHHKLNHSRESEEFLRRLFELDTRIEIDEQGLEPDYSLIYKKVKAEYWFSVRTKTDDEKKEDRQIIEKMSKKREKKRSKWLTVAVIGALAAAAVVAAVLLWKSDDDLRRGRLLVYNNSDDRISITTGPLIRNCPANSLVEITLEVGTYEITITGQEGIQIHTVTIEEDKTVILYYP